MTTPSQPGSPWDRPAPPPSPPTEQPTYPPLDQPVAPLDQPVAPLDQPVAPLDQPVAPLDQPVVPAEPVGSYPPGATAGESWSATAPATTGGSSGSAGTTEVAKQEAANVKDTALDAGGSVAQTAKEQAGSVVSEAKSQAQSLLYQLRSEVQGQSSTQLSRAAGSLHSLSHELGAMASKSDEDGPMTDLVRQASHKGGEIAHWLQDREPRDVLDEVKSFARRRPFAFLGLCFAAGLVAGRVTRGAVAANTSLDSGSSDRSAGKPEFSSEPSWPPAPTPAATVVESAGPSRNPSVAGGLGGAGPVETQVDPLARATDVPPYDEPIR